MPPIVDAIGVLVLLVLLLLVLLLIMSRGRARLESKKPIRPPGDPLPPVSSSWDEGDKEWKALILALLQEGIGGSGSEISLKGIPPGQLFMFDLNQGQFVVWATRDNIQTFLNVMASSSWYLAILDLRGERVKLQQWKEPKAHEAPIVWLRGMSRKPEQQWVRFGTWVQEEGFTLPATQS